MTVVTTEGELRSSLAGRQRPLVLVPTMGALHQGHLALIDHGRDLAGSGGTVVVSIFVNPIQFDRLGDLAAYPQPLDADLAACRAAGVDVVFAPTKESMYFPDRSVTVSESALSKTLCGASRPGHFDGVCTVVLKLFLLTGCAVAVFGEKDFQQLAVIRRMVRDLNVPVEIVGHPTIREADGLAMSSRNLRLSEAQRRDAPRIHQALLEARAAFTRDQPGAVELIGIARKGIEASALARIDYLSLVDAESLQPVRQITRPTVLAAAVIYGEVRLIDHLRIDP